MLYKHHKNYSHKVEVSARGGRYIVVEQSSEGRRQDTQNRAHGVP